MTEGTLYDLLKKKPFQTIQVDNRTRIDRTSFWAWYESQDFYRTVADQQADRLKFGETLTMPEVARLLGTHRNNVYYLVQKGCFEGAGGCGCRCDAVPLGGPIDFAA